MDNFGGGSFAIKNQLMRNFETGNVIIDLLIGSIPIQRLPPYFE